MTVSPTSTKPRRARVAALVAHDGPLAVRLVRILQVFLASVSFLACLVPVLLFEALVGWQPTHAAIALSALAVLPLAPAVFALVSAAERILDHGAEAQAGRTFWRAFASGTRRLWGAGLAVAAAALIIGYDVALLGASDGVVLAAAVAVGGVAALVVSLSTAALADPAASGRDLLTRAVRAVIVRPHLALAWLLIVVVCAAMTVLPVVGTSLALFLPALGAMAVVICTRALGMRAPTQRSAS